MDSKGFLFLSEVQRFIADEAFSFRIVSEASNFLTEMNPLNRKSKNPESRKELTSGKIRKYPELQLSLQQQEGILRLSEEFNLDELDCLDYWISASKQEVRRLLESRLDLAFGSLEYNITTATRKLIFHEGDCIFEAVSLLFKARLAQFPIDKRKQSVMSTTNIVYRGGILSNLMDGISRALVDLASYQLSLDSALSLQNGNTQNHWFANSQLVPERHTLESHITLSRQIFLASSIRRSSEAVFYAFYETQILKEEELKLVAIISELSALIHQRGTFLEISLAGHTGADFGQQASQDELWFTHIVESLLLLQLGHQCGLAQTHDLIDRRVDTAPFSQLANLNELTPNPVAVSQGTWKRYFGLEKPWIAAPVQGYTSLVYAILLQPLVDVDQLPPQAVQPLLLHAADLRAYSYIRKFVLPVIRQMRSCSVSGGRDGSDQEALTTFMLSALSELIGSLLTMFVMECYPDWPFPIGPWSGSGKQKFEDSQWQTDQLGSTARYVLEKMTSSQQRDASNTLCRSDVLDDFLELLDGLSAVYPQFAQSYLWRGSAHHPFLLRAVEDSAIRNSDPALGIRLLAAAACGPLGSTAYPTYLLVDKRLAGHRDFGFFFAYIEDIASQLSGQSGEPTAMLGDKGYLRPLQRDVSTRRTLSPNDTAALLSFCRLLTSISHDTVALESLVSSFRKPDSIVFRLFTLLACPVPSALKGAVFRLLAAMVSSEGNAGKEIASDTWILLEEFQLLPFTESLGTSTGGGGGFASQGLRYELEAVESSTGSYPSTDGFLTLLHALIAKGGQELSALGSGYRPPGVLGYVEFAVQEVLYKLNSRAYSPNEILSEGQKWRLATRVIRILVVILQQYHVNDLSSHRELESDFFGEVTTTPTTSETESTSFASQRVREIPTIQRPTSLGFSLMAWLLARTRLMESVLSLLDEGCVASDTIDTSSLLQAFEVHGTAATCVSFLSRNSPKQQSSVEETKSFLHNNILKQEPSALRLTVDEEIGAGVCDSSHWRERCINSCLGLLYECSLREKVFVERCRSSKENLTMSGVEDGRPNIFVVRVQRLAVVLGTSTLSGNGSLKSSALAIIARAANRTPIELLSIPSSSLLSLLLLRHIAYTGKDSDLNAVSASEYSDLSSAIIRALSRDHSVETAPSISSLVRLGGDSISSKTLLDDFTVSIHNNRIQYDMSDIDDIGLDKPEVLSARAVAIDILVRLAEIIVSGTENTLGVSLFGLSQLLETLPLFGIRKGPDSLRIGLLLDTPKPGMPISCLHALLEILHPRKSDTVVNTPPPLVTVSPALAARALETIYLLCVSNKTCAGVLGLLRRREISFLTDQVHLAFSINSESILSWRRADNGTQRSSYTSHEIQIGLLDYRRMLLKISALEIQALFAVNGQPSDLMDGIVQMFLFGGQESSSAGEPIPLLNMISQISVIDEPSLQAKSPYIAQLMSKCCVDSENEGGIKRIDTRKLVEFLEGNYGNSGSSKIPSSELKLHLKTAIAFNEYNERCVAAARFSESWSQLTCLCLLHGVPLLMFRSAAHLPSTSSNLELLTDITDFILERILVPLSQQLQRGCPTWYFDAVVRVISIGIHVIFTHELPIAEDKHEKLLLQLSDILSIHSSCQPASRCLLISSFVEVLRWKPSPGSDRSLAMKSQVLHRLVAELVTGFSEDCGSWFLPLRLIALGALATLLSNRNYGSESSAHTNTLTTTSRNVEIVRILIRTGLIQKLVKAMELSLSEVSKKRRGNITSLENEDTLLHEEYLWSSISVLTTVSHVSEGALHLVESGIFEFLSSAPANLLPPILTLEDNWLSPSDRSTTQRHLVARISPLARFILSIMNHIKDPVLVDSCTKSIEIMRSHLEFVLRFRIPTIEGMEAIETILHLLSSEFASCIVSGQSYTHLVFGLLANFGISLLPWPLRSVIPLHSTAAQETGNWWSAVVPTCDAERGLDSVCYRVPDCVNTALKSSWSRFDETKLQHALRILSLSSNCVRRIASSRLESSNTCSLDKNQVGEELRIVCDALSNCMQLIVTMERSQPDRNDSLIAEESTAVAKPNSGDLDVVIVSVSENLCCALHDIFLFSTERYSEVVPPASLAICIQLVNFPTNFSSRSFLRTVMQWIENTSAVKR